MMFLNIINRNHDGLLVLPLLLLRIQLTILIILLRRLNCLLQCFIRLDFHHNSKNQSILAVLWLPVLHISISIRTVS